MQMQKARSINASELNRIFALFLDTLLNSYANTLANGKINTVLLIRSLQENMKDVLKYFFRVKIDNKIPCYI